MVECWAIGQKYNAANWSQQENILMRGGHAG